MNFVEPIRDRKKIPQIKNLLRGEVRFRDLLLFMMGINSAQTISDLLQLQIGHFTDESGRPKRRFWIQEQKRGKRHEVTINNSIRETLDEYLKAYQDIDEKPENCLFINSKRYDYARPIKRGQAWKFIVSICAMLGCRAIMAPIIGYEFTYTRRCDLNASDEKKSKYLIECPMIYSFSL